MLSHNLHTLHKVVPKPKHKLFTTQQEIYSWSKNVSWAINCQQPVEQLARLEKSSQILAPWFWFWFCHLGRPLTTSLITVTRSPHIGLTGPNIPRKLASRYLLCCCNRIFWSSGSTHGDKLCAVDLISDNSSIWGAKAFHLRTPIKIWRLADQNAKHCTAANLSQVGSWWSTKAVLMLLTRRNESV